MNNASHSGHFGLLPHPSPPPSLVPVPFNASPFDRSRQRWVTSRVYALSCTKSTRYIVDLFNYRNVDRQTDRQTGRQAVNRCDSIFSLAEQQSHDWAYDQLYYKYLAHTSGHKVMNSSMVLASRESSKLFIHASTQTPTWGLIFRWWHSVTTCMQIMRCWVKLSLQECNCVTALSGFGWRYPPC